MVEFDKVQLQFSSGLVIDNFVRYSFTNDFAANSDGFDFEIEDENLSNIVNKIRLAETFTLKVNDSVQAKGRVTGVKFTHTRSGGLHASFKACDLLGAVCKASIDPEINITAKDTLESAIKKAMSPFGFSKFEFDDSANRNLITGAKQGKKIGGKKAKGKAASLQKFISHQCKPNNGESVFGFVERICKRFGLRVWLSVDGETVYVSDADFDSPPLYTIDRSKSPKNSNCILDGSVEVDWDNQPSIIISQGKGGGGKFSKNKFHVLMVNEFTGLVRTAASYGPNPIQNVPTSKVQEFITKYKNKGSKLIDTRPDLIDQLPATIIGVYDPISRPYFFFDEESKNSEELEFSTRRKMAEFQSKFLKLNYSVDGHSNRGTEAIYSVNTNIVVNDETLGVEGEYWIKKRTFTKSRGDGTKTHLELILKHCME